jgi:membrane dipeptidase
MSIYTPATMGDGAEATANAHMLIDWMEEIVADNPGKFALAYSVAEAKVNFENGLISFPLGMENGSPIAGNLENLRAFHARGIRYITLTHSSSNHISDSSYDENKQWGGLSPFGEEVVREMNRLGIMVDVSHVSDEAFWDVLEITQVPVVATHSSARHFTPGFERNMSDDMLKALGENGGVIMINFGSAFLTEEANNTGFFDAFAAHLEENNLEFTPETEAAFRAEFFGEEGYPFADLSDVLDHIDHVVNVAGIDHVGLGSDYDGVGDSLPTGLKNVSTYPNLVQGLMDRGYTEEDIEKILSGNALRVWRAAETYAEAANS